MIAKEIFENSGKTYGSRRMAKALSSPEKDFSRHKARTLMKKLQLKYFMRIILEEKNDMNPQSFRFIENKTDKEITSEYL